MDLVELQEQTVVITSCKSKLEQLLVHSSQSKLVVGEHIEQID